MRITFCLIFIFMIAVVGGSCDFAEIEPNNNFSVANVVNSPLCLGDEISLIGQTSSGDLDVFKIVGDFQNGDRLRLSRGQWTGGLSFALFNPSREIIYSDAYSRIEDVLFLANEFGEEHEVPYLYIAYHGLTSDSYLTNVGLDKTVGVLAAMPQIVYLDFNGAQDVRIHLAEPISFGDIGDSWLNTAYPGQNEFIKNKIVETTRENFEGYNILFYTSDDFPEGLSSDQVSTIYFGGYSQMYMGLADDFDKFNQNHHDNAIVYVDTYETYYRNFGMDAEQLATMMGNIASHEMGHLLSLYHTADSDEIMDSLGSAYGIAEDQQFGRAPLQEIFTFAYQNAPERFNVILGPIGNSCTDFYDNDLDGVSDLSDPDCVGGGSDGPMLSPGREDTFNSDMQCSDGIDNDNDGTMDMNDFSCSSLTDNDETNPKAQCQDGIDNDGDGVTDYPDDLSCSGLQDNDETNPKAQCQDGIDNDGDGVVDMNDFSCSSLQDNDETNPKAQCQDRIDNDGDGLIDLEDPSCESLQDDDELYEWFAIPCAETDNGLNKFVVGNAKGTLYNDSYVLSITDSCVSSSQLKEWFCTADERLTSQNFDCASSCINGKCLAQCGDGIDNDGDGVRDYPDDLSCSSLNDNSESFPKMQCYDGFDNDRDRYVDLEDPNCEDTQDNSEDVFDYGRTECSDRIDNDGDGLIDMEDSNCDNEREDNEANLIWDNFYDGGYNENLGKFLPSTEYFDAWAGDDMDIGQCVVLKKVEWYGAKWPQDALGTMKFRLMNAEYNPDACGHPVWWDDWWSCGWNNLEIVDVESGLQPVASLTGDIVSDGNNNFEVYHGSVELEDVIVPAGHYYYALSSERDTQDHYIMVSNSGGTMGLTEAYIENPVLGATEPMPYSLVQFNGQKYDLDYRIYGVLADQTSSECRVCGDGVVQEGEECDDGGRCSDNNARCTLGDLSNCGNPNEVNCLPTDGDACNANCETEFTARSGDEGQSENEESVPLSPPSEGNVFKKVWGWMKDLF
jgi:hypothetical protein